MPNKNYERGRRYEYELAKELREKQGFEVMRTAGSHGLFDLIAINPKLGNIMLIQCKVTDSESESKRLCSEFRENPPIPPYALPKKVCQVMSVKITQRKSDVTRRETYV